MKEKIVGTLSAGMTSMKKGIQSGVDSCKLGGVKFQNSNM